MKNNIGQKIGRNQRVYVQGLGIRCSRYETIYVPEAPGIRGSRHQKAQVSKRLGIRASRHLGIRGPVPPGPARCIRNQVSECSTRPLLDRARKKPRNILPELFVFFRHPSWLGSREVETSSQLQDKQWESSSCTAAVKSTILVICHCDRFAAVVARDVATPCLKKKCVSGLG